LVIVAATSIEPFLDIGGALCVKPEYSILP